LPWLALQCEELRAEGAAVAESPAALAASCDLVFAMLADPEAALDVVFAPETGVLAGMRPGCGYVDMSTVDEATSMRIGEAVVAKGGRFLEVVGCCIVAAAAQWARVFTRSVL
jgi:glyoxylate/succinic semialdehyde reductase